MAKRISHEDSMIQHYLKMIRRHVAFPRAVAFYETRLADYGVLA